MRLAHSFRSRFHGFTASITTAARHRRQLRGCRQLAIAARSVAEPLETRTMLTTSVSLTGDAGASAFYVLNSGGSNGGNVEFFQNMPSNVSPASPVVTVPYADLGPVTITGGSGAATVTLDFSGGDLFPNGFDFVGQHSTTIAPNQLIVTGDQNANYTLSSSQLAITGSGISDTVAFTNIPSLSLFNSGGTSSFEVSSGSFTFNSDLGGKC
jgi:hypothetical protein